MQTPTHAAAQPQTNDDTATKIQLMLLAPELRTALEWALSRIPEDMRGDFFDCAEALLVRAKGGVAANRKGGNRISSLFPRGVDARPAPAVSQTIAGDLPIGDTLQAILAEIKGLREDQRGSTRIVERPTPEFIPVSGAAEWLKEDSNDRRFTPIHLDGARPPVGGLWLQEGGIYAGIARGVDGQPDHHLILSGLSPVDPLGWQEAMDWAKVHDNNGCTDWTLPTRAESALLFANLKDQFEDKWYWTSEQFSAHDAWYQWFGDGNQYYGVKSYEGRARAVRRLVIQPFSHS